MKRLLPLIFILNIAVVAAQSNIDTTIKVDLLRAPVSPASNLLGIASSDIDKPTDLSAFMLSLQSGTNSFTKLPSNYAIDIAPYFLFKNARKGDITTEGFKASGGKEVLKQSLVLSFAIKNPDSLENGYNFKSTYGGIGLKVSIFRGKYDEPTLTALSKIQKLQSIKLLHLEKIMTGYKANVDPEVIELREKRKNLILKLDRNSPDYPARLQALTQSDEYVAITKSLNQKLEKFAELEKNEALQNIDNQIEQIAANFQTNRIGFTWDVNAGISAEFVNKRFDNSRVNNAGLWTNLGYTTKTGNSFLFLARILHNPNQIFANDNATNTQDDILTLDGGFKYAFSKSQSKFNCSAESIYRSILTKNTLDPSWRLILNADYSIWQNQKITFSFGRNFDGAISKDGNLIAALSFLTGFGNRR